MADAKTGETRAVRADARGDLLPRTLEWIGGAEGELQIVDQTLLPLQVEMRRCGTVEEVWEAIRLLRVRGAPAIGVAAAYGLCLGTRAFREGAAAAFLEQLSKVSDYLVSCRPTAVNLAWAVERVRMVAGAHAGDAAAAWQVMLDEAHAIARQDAEACRRIGEAGADLIPEGGGVLTHCNAGALATVAYGTALSVMYVAHERGRRFKVYADETRPLLQGARLTSFELDAAGLDVTVLCDSAAASLMKAGRVQLVITGADRVAANGDAANKIGTYGLAVAAHHHGIPLYIAVPLSTFDRTLASGADIPIELRDEEEIRAGLGRRTVAEHIACWNPAFDVTPAELISGIITEQGILQPVTAAGVNALFEQWA